MSGPSPSPEPLPPPTPPPRRSWPRRLLNRLEVDQAVFFSVLTRAWQFLAGPVTILVIAARFSPTEQGYFYTFASLMAWQTLLELGLHGVVVSIASHEWAELELDPAGRVTGAAQARARLAELCSAMLRWYAGVSLLFVAGMIPFGSWFFTRDEGEIVWRTPWVALVVLHGGLIGVMPLISLLEGCRQVVPVNRVRFTQAVTGHLVVWGCILGGLGLWTAAVSALVRLLWDVWLVCGRFGSFFDSLRGSRPTGAIDWSREVWPLQWRTAARATITFLSLGLLVPVVFHYHGNAVAGRLGMTWSAIVALDAAAFAWVQTRVPLFGSLIARRDFPELDRVFFRVSGIACLVFAAGAAVLCVVVAALPVIPLELAERLADRLLTFGPTALFCAATLLTLGARCLGVYVLAHKRDPYIRLALLPSIVAAPVVYFTGRHYGPTGEAVGLLCVAALLTLPISAWIWSTCRREWH